MDYDWDDDDSLFSNDNFVGELDENIMANEEEQVAQLGSGGDGDDDDDNNGGNNDNNCDESNGEPVDSITEGEGEPVALRGGGENVTKHNSYEYYYCYDYRYNEVGEPAKVLDYKELPLALQGGGASKTTRTTKNRRMTRSTLEQRRATVSADAGLSLQDHPELEVSSPNSSPNTVNNSNLTSGVLDYGHFSDHNDDTLEGDIDRDSMIEDDQPIALRGGGASRVNKQTKKKKLTKAETDRMREQQWADLVGDAELEDISSSGSDSSSAIGESDSDGMSIDSPIRHKDGEDRGLRMDSGDGEGHTSESGAKVESSPQQRRDASKGKRIQLQSPPVSTRTRGTHTPNLQSTPGLATAHNRSVHQNDDTPIPESLGHEAPLNPYLQHSPRIRFNSDLDVLGLPLPGDTPPGPS
jgi:hypothetical protein